MLHHEMTYSFSWRTHGSFGTLITLYTWITITPLKFKTSQHASDYKSDNYTGIPGGPGSPTLPCSPFIPRCPRLPSVPLNPGSPGGPYSNTITIV